MMKNRISRFRVNDANVAQQVKDVLVQYRRSVLPTCTLMYSLRYERTISSYLGMFLIVWMCESVLCA